MRLTKEGALVHKKLIAAWTKGFGIEVWDPANKVWNPVKSPLWSAKTKYRLQAPKYLRITNAEAGSWADGHVGAVVRVDSQKIRTETVFGSSFLVEADHLGFPGVAKFLSVDNCELSNQTAWVEAFPAVEVSLKHIAESAKCPVNALRVTWI